MKKHLNIIVTIITIILVLCSCGNTSSSGTKLKIASQSGGTEYMTTSEIKNLKNNNGRDYDTKINGASISGEGKITSIGDYQADAFDMDHNPIRYHVTIIVNNDVELYVSCKNEMDLYEGDIISFTGECTGAFNRILLNLNESNISLK